MPPSTLALLTPPQMLRMAFEREVIMNIRYRVDAHDEQCLFENGGPHLSTDPSAIHSHTRLGSLDGIMHVSSYAKKIRKDIHLQDLQKLLATFLRLGVVFDAKDNAISGFKVSVACVR